MDLSSSSLLPVVANAPGAERSGERREVLARLVSLTHDDPRYQSVREECVRAYQPMVIGLARRFFGRGEAQEDLIQVANVGLLVALDRFDLAKGVRFEAYAVPTIVGEIKRHFRDRGWAIRVSRRLQELKLSPNAAQEKLFQANGRRPTVPELAACLGITEEETLEGLEAACAYVTWSLDAPVPGDDREITGAETLGGRDDGLGLIEDRETLKPLLDSLPERERHILLMRFFGNMTQEQIAGRMGVSQMHISRLLSRTLTWLRQEMLAEEPAEEGSRSYGVYRRPRPAGSGDGCVRRGPGCSRPAARSRARAGRSGAMLATEA